MKHPFLSILILLFLVQSCGNPIKDEGAIVDVEQGTDVVETPVPEAPAPVPATEVGDNSENEEYLGSWVGYFRKDTGNDGDYDDRSLFLDEGYVWDRENKINLSIDKIIGDSVIGHSVVAGNDRPFYGRMGRDGIADPMTFKVREPGDDKYDGAFTFYIEDDVLEGTWLAYGNINIRKRRYQLEKKEFAYDPDIMIEYAKQFVDWTNSIEEKVTEDYGDGEFEEWMQSQYATATEAIYEINASNRRLKKSEVDNLKKGDLTIIRNTIYARHGYSFKNRPLRVFFDAQPWYIPIHTDIRSDFTDLEKENIRLLLKYEKNAAEYYDSFGRG
ncbi:YARHG domain-containing protein [Neolewinella persica]|uniref:YARHG domain-containing protein n=1 Tax=Neolewinella persica TaxID=70998 RepID=UPI00035F146C|nr:YARHG domain-containing protein [Neolewinella persica]